MQTRKLSLIEAATNTAVGFVLSFALQSWIFQELSHGFNLGVTAAFTVLSLVRGYVLRRAFNRYRAARPYQAVNYVDYLRRRS